MKFTSKPMDNNPEPVEINEPDKNKAMEEVPKASDSNGDNDRPNSDGKKALSGETGDNVVNIDGKNIAVKTGEGSQYNYYGVFDTKKIIKHDLSVEELNKICKYHTFHMERHTLDLLRTNRFIILYGEKGVGKSSLALHMLSEMAIQKVTCFDEIDKDSFFAFDWHNQYGYVYECNDKSLKFSKIFLLELTRKLLNKDSYLVIIVTPEVYSSFDAEIQDQAVHVKFPGNKMALVKKRILAKYEDVYGHGDDRFKTSLEHVCEDKWITKKIETWKSMDDLVRLSNKLFDYLCHHTDGFDQIEMEKIIFEVNCKEDWLELVESLNNFQERLLLLTVSFLTGFSKERLSEFYLKLQTKLQPILSKPDRDEVENNIFWSKQWDVKLETIGVVTREHSSQDTRFNDKIITVYMPEDRADKIINYFLEQYNWFNDIELWLLDMAFSVVNQTEHFIVCKALAKLSRLHISGILDHFIGIYNETFEDADFHIINYLQTVAITLRCIYDDAVDLNIKKSIKLFIHEKLISKKIRDCFLGLHIYMLGFSDIELNNIILDLFIAYEKHKSLDFLVSSAVCDLIYFHEERADWESGVIYKLTQYHALWDGDHTKFICSIINHLKSRRKSKWIKSKSKKYTYPFCLYLFAANPLLRETLIDFIIKAMKNPKTDHAALTLVEYLYREKLKDKDTFRLTEMYMDFVSRIKSKDRYCNSYITGMEKSVDAVRT